MNNLFGAVASFGLCLAWTWASSAWKWNEALIHSKNAD